MERSRREILQEVIEPVPSFKVLDQGSNRYSRSLEDGSASQDLGSALNSRVFNHDLLSFKLLTFKIPAYMGCLVFVKQILKKQVPVVDNPGLLFQVGQPVVPD